MNLCRFKDDRYANKRYIRMLYRWKKLYTLTTEQSKPSSLYNVTDWSLSQRPVKCTTHSTQRSFIKTRKLFCGISYQTSALSPGLKIAHRRKRHYSPHTLTLAGYTLTKGLETCNHASQILYVMLARPPVATSIHRFKFACKGGNKQTKRELGIYKHTYVVNIFLCLQYK